MCVCVCVRVCVCVCVCVALVRNKECCEFLPKKSCINSQRCLTSYTLLTRQRASDLKVAVPSGSKTFKRRLVCSVKVRNIFGLKQFSTTFKSLKFITKVLEYKAVLHDVIIV